jgi:hypothetical protein
MNCRHVGMLLALVMVAGTSCKKNALTSRTAVPVAHVQGTPHTDEVLTAWRNAGLELKEFSPIPPAPSSAAYCEHGMVGGVDTVLCEYASDQAVAQGLQQVKEGWSRVDAHTGVILQAKRTTMAAVDRERREPSGKTINAMVKAFRKL